MSFSMVERLAATIVNTNPAGLDALSQALATDSGGLSDDARHLAIVLIQERRKAPAATRRRVGGLGLRPRKPRKHADSIARRRRCAASGAVPPAIAANFTQGEVAVLSVITGEVRRNGRCDLCNDAIAARSGTSRSVVNRALRAAKVCGYIKVQERRRRGAKSLTNIITITSALWRAWLSHDRAPKGKGVQYQSFDTSQDERGPTRGPSREGALPQQGLSERKSGETPPSRPDLRVRVERQGRIALL